MRARPTWMALAGWMAASAFLGQPPAAQTPEGRLLGGFGVLKPVEDPSAEVMESIRRKIPANRNLTLQAPEFRFLNPAPVWDERKFSSAAWKRLREILASEKIFREIRTDRPGDLLFRIVVTNVAPAEGMSGSLLEVEGRLEEGRTGTVLGGVHVLAVATGGAGVVSPTAAEEIPHRAAEALARFVGRVFR